MYVHYIHKNSMCPKYIGEEFYKIYPTNSF